MAPSVDLPATMPDVAVDVFAEDEPTQATLATPALPALGDEVPAQRAPETTNASRVHDEAMEDLLRMIEPAFLEPVSSANGAIGQLVPQQAAPPTPAPEALPVVPMNPVTGKMSLAQIEELAYQATMIPEVLEVARTTYDLSPAEFAQVVTSPLYLAGQDQARKQLKADPMASVRLLARAALPDVVTQLRADATNVRSEARERVMAAKMLADLAEPPAQKTVAGTGNLGAGGVNLQINLGATLGSHLARAQAVPVRDTE
jgi:hypothetical protein